MRWVLFTFFIISCGHINEEINASMEVAEDVAYINNSTANIDDTVALAIKNDDTSNLKPVFKETKNIRDKTEEIKQRFKKLLQRKLELEKELQQEEKLVWVDLIYRLAPVALGLIMLLAGRFITQDSSDTKFGIVCFISGIAINAFYDTVGNWGILGMAFVGCAWMIYIYQKKDIAKKQKATSL